jgi:short-subunit dehydrogenase
MKKWGEWALVTGASDGIGREIAICLAARGMKLVLVARRAELLREITAVETRVVALDLTEPGAVASLAQQTEGLDIGLVVAAAGFGSSGNFIDSDVETEMKMIQLNCMALAEMAWVYGRQMKERGGGGLILLSSILAFQGVGKSANYAATKAYVQTLAEGLRVEMKPFGVQVLASAPGPTASGFAARAGMNMGNTMSAREVAQDTLNALERGGTVRPGWLSKLLGYSLMTLPRWGRTLLLSQIMEGMSKREDGKAKKAA